MPKGKLIKPEEHIPNGKDIDKMTKAYRKFMSKRGYIRLNGIKRKE